MTATLSRPESVKTSWPKPETSIERDRQLRCCRALQRAAHLSGIDMLISAHQYVTGALRKRGACFRAHFRPQPYCLHYGNQSRGYFNYGRPLWPPAVPRLAARPSQSNPRGSGPEVVKRERGHVTSETWSLCGGGLQGPPA